MTEDGTDAMFLSVRLMDADRVLTTESYGDRNGQLTGPLIAPARVLAPERSDAAISHM